MKRRAFLGTLALMALPQAAFACEPPVDPDMRPWAERIVGVETVFVGTVTEIRGSEGQVWTAEPECAAGRRVGECEAYWYGFNDVVFTVELPVRGITDKTFIVEQGRGTDCMIEFGIGQRWIYAGNAMDAPSMYLHMAN